MERLAFTIYKDNPNKPGYMLEDRNATVKEIETALISYLKEYPYKDSNIYDYLDHIADCTWLLPENNLRSNDPIPAFDYIICYPVQGSSEGWYFHFEVLGLNNERFMIILGKTLCGMEDALNINTAINKFILSSRY